MENAKRRRRSDTNHALYMLVNVVTEQHYVGITVCGRNPQAALKVRWQKHVRRALTENRDWLLCDSIRQHGPEAFVMLLIDVVRGRALAHQQERQLVNTGQATLNSN